MICGIIIVHEVVFGQKVTILDSTTKWPIESVNITCNSDFKTISTDAFGQADLSVFKDQNIIKISMIGYETQIVDFAELIKQNFTISLQSKSDHLEGVVISASRYKQSMRYLPYKITSISSEYANLFQPSTTADLLGSTGEVFIQKSQQGGGSPMIRGFATNSLLYILDGVRMNTAIYRGGNIHNIISLDPMAIERTEILFGSGSNIYGSDAIGGVMSFQTITPKLHLGVTPKVNGTFSSRFVSANQELSHHFDVQIGHKKWASVTSFSFSDFGNVKMGKRGPDEYLQHNLVSRIDSIDRVISNADPSIQVPTAFSQMHLMQKLRFVLNQKWDFQYTFQGSETSDFDRYDRLRENQPNGLPLFAEWKYGPQRWMMNLGTISYQAGKKWVDKAVLRIAHQYFEESRIDRRFNHYRLRTQKEVVNAYSINLDLEKQWNQNRLNYGIEYVLNNVKSRGSAIDIRNGGEIKVADRYPGSMWNSYAGYLNYQYIKSNQWSFLSGVRLNGVEVHSDFSRNREFYPFEVDQIDLKNYAITGSIGLVYSPSNSSKVSLSGSTGFRAPNVDDIGKIFEFSNSEVVIPNPSLRPEYIYHGELSFYKEINKLLHININGFYTYMNGAMVRRPTSVNGNDSVWYDGMKLKAYSIQNAAFRKVYGINMNVELHILAGLTITSTYQYQIGYEEMDDYNIYRSRHAAPGFGQTKILFQTGPVSMMVYGMYSAQVNYTTLNPEERQKPAIYAKDAVGNPYSPRWYTINFKSTCQINDIWKISTGIENISDQRYRPYSSGLVAPGRNFIVSVSAKF